MWNRGFTKPHLPDLLLLVLSIKHNSPKRALCLGSRVWKFLRYYRRSAHGNDLISSLDEHNGLGVSTTAGVRDAARSSSRLAAPEIIRVSCYRIPCGPGTVCTLLVRWGKWRNRNWSTLGGERGARPAKRISYLVAHLPVFALANFDCQVSGRMGRVARGAGRIAPSPPFNQPAARIDGEASPHVGSRRQRALGFCLWRSKGRQLSDFAERYS